MKSPSYALVVTVAIANTARVSAFALNNNYRNKPPSVPASPVAVASSSTPTPDDAGDVQAHPTSPRSATVAVPSSSTGDAVDAAAHAPPANRARRSTSSATVAVPSSTAGDAVDDAAQAPPAKADRRSTTHTLPREVDEASSDKPSSKGGGAIVLTTDENVQFTAGLVGGIVGLTMDGPIMAGAIATAANYLARKDDNPAGEAVAAVSRKGIEAFNYFVELESRYEVLDSASKKIRESLDLETYRKVESVARGVSDKWNALEDEYGFVDAAAKSLGLIGDKVETTVDNSINFAKVNNVGDKVLEAGKTSIDTVKGKLPEGKD